MTWLSHLPGSSSVRTTPRMSVADSNGKHTLCIIVSCDKQWPTKRNQKIWLLPEEAKQYMQLRKRHFSSHLSDITIQFIDKLWKGFPLLTKFVVGIRFSWCGIVKNEVSEILFNTISLWRRWTLWTKAVTCLWWPLRLLWSLKCQNSLCVTCRVGVSRVWRTKTTNATWTTPPALTTDTHSMA